MRGDGWGGTGRCTEQRGAGHLVRMPRRRRGDQGSAPRCSGMGREATSSLLGGPRSSPPPRLPGCAVSRRRPPLTLTQPAGLGYSPGTRCPRCGQEVGLLRRGCRVTGSQPREAPDLSPRRRRPRPRAGRPRPRGGGAPGGPARRVGARSFFFPRRPDAGAGDCVAGTPRAPGFRAGEAPGGV